MKTTIMGILLCLLCGCDKESNQRSMRASLTGTNRASVTVSMPLTTNAPEAVSDTDSVDHMVNAQHEQIRVSISNAVVSAHISGLIIGWHG